MINPLNRRPFYHCNCGGTLHVTETRATEDAVWRQRKCKSCGWLYASREVYVEASEVPRGVSRIGRRKPQQEQANA